MGPSIFIDGEVRMLSRANRRFLLASMGPSIFIDGEDWLSPRDWIHRRIASMGPSIFIDGECRYGCGCPRVRRRFNGAVDLHRRRVTGRGGVIVVDEGRASMGPSIFIDGETNNPADLGALQAS